MFNRRNVLCLSLVIGLGACAAPLPENTVPLHRGGQAVIHAPVVLSDSVAVLNGVGLQAGGVIVVSITDEEELSGTYMLNERGIATMPLIGEVNLTGLDAEGARDYIGAQYKDGYLRAPEVALEIINMGAQSL